MLKFLGRRLLFIGLSLFVASILIFILVELMPGDVAKVIMGQYATPEALSALRQKLGLNKPPYIRYLLWLSQMLHGNFGESLYMEGVKIGPLVWRRALNSALLAFVGLVFFVPISLLLGVVAGIKEGKWLSSLISISGPATSNIPPDSTIFQSLDCLVLPAVSVTLVMFGYVARMTRSSMITVLRSNYIRTAVLKGLPRRYIIFKHALKNALLPSVTVIGMNIGWLFGGLVVVEALFGYPGIGFLLVLALQSRDIPLIEVIMLLIIFVYLVANFVTDLIYSVLNPRINVRE